MDGTDARDSPSARSRGPGSLGPAEARIAVGPTFGEFGGVSQHVRALAKYSRYHPHMFRVPPWSVFHPAWSRALGAIEANRWRVPDLWMVNLARSLKHCDLIHLHAFPFWMDAYLRPKNPRAKFVVTVHQIFDKTDVKESQWPHFEALNANLFEACRTADGVISVATWQTRALEAKGIRAETIPNGVTLAAVQGDAERFRSKYHLRGPFFLTAAALLPYKRPELLVAAARALPDQTFVMTGRGTTKDALKNYLGAAPPPNVLPMGELPRQDLLDAYFACTAFVLPSARDTFPTALLEAMAAKRPVVAARAAGPEEIVRDRETGFLFTPDDEGSLISAIERATIAPSTMGDAAYRRAQDFDWPRVAERIDALYARLLRNRASSG
ncbi:MAG: glycosyltransferase family 4 protein [Thermoplasmatota archaeon]